MTFDLDIWDAARWFILTPPGSCSTVTGGKCPDLGNWCSRL